MIYLTFLIPFLIIWICVFIDTLSFYLFDKLIYSSEIIKYLDLKEKPIIFSNLFSLIIIFHLIYSKILENQENKYRNLNEFILNFIETCILLIIFKMDNNLFAKLIYLIFSIIFIKATIEYFIIFLKTK